MTDVPAAATGTSLPAASRIAVWALVGLTLVSFGRICGQRFTWWDDNLTIHHNVSFDPPTIHDILWYWGHPHVGMYAPVPYTAWGLISLVAWKPVPDENGISLNPLYFHLASLIAHIITVVAVFALLNRLVRKDWAAFAGAAIFAVHPLQVETVAWATSLKEGLCGLFGVLSLYYYVAAIDGGTSGILAPPGDRTANATPLRWRRVYYGAALLMLAMAELSNPLAVTIPAMAFVLDGWLVRRSFAKAALAVAPLVLVSVAGGIIAKLVQPGVAAPLVPLWMRPLIAGDTLAFYFYKLVHPVDLAADYGRRPALVVARGWIHWTWVVPVVLALGIILLGRGRRWLTGGALLFVIGVLPVLGFVPFDLQRFSTPADRYVYLAMLGPALIVAAFFAKTSGQVWWTMCGAIVVLFAVCTIIQCGVWRDDMTLWKHAIAAAPDSFVAHANLGASYNRLGRAFDLQAVQQYAASVRINPDFFEGHENCAVAWLRIGNEDAALPEIIETLRLEDHIHHPTRFGDHPHLYLGRLLLKRRRGAEAIPHLQRAMEQDKTIPGLLFDLGAARIISSGAALSKGAHSLTH